MFNPLAARDNKRNTDIMYKGRFERAEQQRFQMELQLNIINFYASVVESSSHVTPPSVAKEGDAKGTTTSMEILTRLNQIDILVQEIQQLMEASSSAFVRKDGLTSSDIEECESLSRLEYETINYLPGKITLASLKTLLEPFQFNDATTDHQELKPSCLITCDPTSLVRIVHAAKGIFPAPGIVQIAYDRESNSLTLRMKDSADHGGLSHLFDQVDRILAGQAIPLPYESITMLFIAKCLSRSMGGDVTLDGVELIISIAAALDCSDESFSTTPAIVPSRRSYEDVDRQPDAGGDYITPPSPPLSSQPTPPRVATTSLNLPKPPPVSALPAASTVAHVDALQGRKLNILLVEDNFTLQRVFKRWWEKREHNVFIARDGQEAIDMFKEQNYSIVFSDIEIPIKDGFAVTREIRAFEAEKNRKPTPIIGLSGHERKAYAETAISSGMNDFTSKGSGFQMYKIYELVVRYCT